MVANGFQSWDIEALEARTMGVTVIRQGEGDRNYTGESRYLPRAINHLMPKS